MTNIEHRPFDTRSLETLLEQAAEVIEAGVQSTQESNEVLTVTGLLASLKDARVVEQFMDTRSIMSLLSETPLFQMLTQETREQARLDTLRNSILRQLERRLATVPDDLREQLQQITDPEQLDQLLDAAVDSATLDDFLCHL